MPFDFQQLLGLKPRDFSFHVEAMGLSSAHNIISRIANVLLKNEGTSPETHALIRKFAQTSVLLDQATENVKAIEAALNDPKNIEARTVFTTAMSSVADAMAASMMDGLSGLTDDAGADETEVDEEDCGTCTDLSCAYHPSKSVAAAVEASAEKEDDDVRFIDDKEDAETAGARRLDLTELPPELRNIISMLTSDGKTQVHAFRVMNNPSH